MLKKLLFAVVLSSLASVSFADRLDNVIKSKVLNCGVVLDFPPMGYFDKDNKPVGFDVDYCKDLATALGVRANIKNLTWAERIPSLISGATDVVIGSTSDTLERAKSVGFSKAYFVFKFQVFSKKNIESFNDLKNLKVGTAIGTTYETEFKKYAKARGWSLNKYTSFKSENDAFLGLYQGKVDAIITTNTNIAVKLQTKEFKNFKAGPFLPGYDDVVGIIAPRQELAWIEYINLFLTHQVRDGNFSKLHQKHFGTPNGPSLITGAQ